MPRTYRHETIAVGDRFGRLTVDGPTVTRKAGKQAKTFRPCVCDCGSNVTVMVYSLTSGKTRSCGCLSPDTTSLRHTRHGLSRTRIHNEWCAVRQRCHNPNAPSFKNYGARGIAVCREWRESFEAFRDWALMNGYRDDLTIERKDVNGPYSPENCTWIPLNRQALNRRSSLLVTAFGETKAFEDWSRDARCKVSRAVFYYRIRRKADPETAMTEPSERGPRRLHYVTAFGETRLARHWADDPRCPVTYNGLLLRLKRGVAPETAITQAKP